MYAHGTNITRRYDLADFSDSTNPAYSEAVLLAALYAAQGYIVVAPNYAGYDSSPLTYHPYLNADQQSKDVINALKAARTAITNGLPSGVSDNGKLFITGYSQGGHVAMATHQALQALGQTVTAAAPMSGPYAMEAFGDAIYYGNVDLGSTVFSPLLSTSYQKAYGNIYTQLTDIYNPTYATGIDTLLPSNTPLNTIFAQGLLPQTALFSSTPPTAPAGAPASLQAILNSITPPTTPAAQAPLFALGFGSSPLINNTARLNYLLDAIANPDGAVPTDLRNWVPTRPVLLCGGNADPTVFFNVNTQLMQGFWTAPSPAAMPAGLLNVLDIDSAPTSASDPYAALKVAFAQVKAQTAAAAVAGGATDGGASAVVQAYHGTLVPPFCTTAARGFFQQVLAAGL